MGRLREIEKKIGKMNLGNESSAVKNGLEEFGRFINHPDLQKKEDVIEKMVKAFNDYESGRPFQSSIGNMLGMLRIKLKSTARPTEIKKTVETSGRLKWAEEKLKESLGKNEDVDKIIGALMSMSVPHGPPIETLLYKHSMDEDNVEILRKQMRALTPTLEHLSKIEPNELTMLLGKSQTFRRATDIVNDILEKVEKGEKPLTFNTMEELKQYIRPKEVVEERDVEKKVRDEFEKVLGGTSPDVDLVFNSLAKLGGKRKDIVRRFLFGQTQELATKGEADSEKLIKQLRVLAPFLENLPGTDEVVIKDKSITFEDLKKLGITKEDLKKKGVKDKELKKKEIHFRKLDKLDIKLDGMYHVLEELFGKSKGVVNLEHMLKQMGGIDELNVISSEAIVRHFFPEVEVEGIKKTPIEFISRLSAHEDENIQELAKRSSGMFGSLGTYLSMISSVKQQDDRLFLNKGMLMNELIEKAGLEKERTVDAIKSLDGLIETEEKRLNQEIVEKRTPKDKVKKMNLYELLGLDEEKILKTLSEKGIPEDKGKKFISLVKKENEGFIEKLRPIYSWATKMSVYMDGEAQAIQSIAQRLGKEDPNEIKKGLTELNEYFGKFIDVINNKHMPLFRKEKLGIDVLPWDQETMEEGGIDAKQMRSKPNIEHERYVKEVSDMLVKVNQIRGKIVPSLRARAVEGEPHKKGDLTTSLEILEGGKLQETSVTGLFKDFELKGYGHFPNEFPIITAANKPVVETLGKIEEQLNELDKTMGAKSLSGILDNPEHELHETVRGIAKKLKTLSEESLKLNEGSKLLTKLAKSLVNVDKSLPITFANGPDYVRNPQAFRELLEKTVAPNLKRRQALDERKKKTIETAIKTLNKFSKIDPEVREKISSQFSPLDVSIPLLIKSETAPKKAKEITERTPGMPSAPMLPPTPKLPATKKKEEKKE